MPRKKPVKIAKCAAVVNGRRCQTPGKGDPPLCKKHEEYRQGTVVNEVVGAVMEQPVIKKITSRFVNLLDGAGSIVDRISSGDFEFLGRNPDKPKVHFDPAMAQIQAARVTLGFGPDEEPTEAAIKERRKQYVRVFHPDAGGDQAAMQRINAAADLLLGKFKK